MRLPLLNPKRVFRFPRLCVRLKVVCFSFRADQPSLKASVAPGPGSIIQRMVSQLDLLYVVAMTPDVRFGMPFLSPWQHSRLERVHQVESVTSLTNLPSARGIHPLYVVEYFSSFFRSEERCRNGFVAIEDNQPRPFFQD